MASRSREGFALPAVLAVVGVVTLVFLVAITALASLTAEAASARARVRFMEAALSAEARLLFMAATEPVSQTGFEVGAARAFDEYSGGDQAAAQAPATLLRDVTLPVRLDGRAYRMEGDHPVVVRLQDQAGLINLMGISADAQRRLFEAMGIAPARFDAFIARLIDYMDIDDLSQIEGAESGQYPGDGPPNRALRRPSEFLSVLEARESVNGPAWRRLRPNLTADANYRAINLNTMTPTALAVVLGLQPAQIESVVGARETVAFQSLDSFNAVSGAGLVYDPDVQYLFPASRFVYEIADTRSPWVYRGRVTLTPYGIERPLWIDQTEQTEAPRRAVIQPSDATDFPYTPR